MKKLILYIGGIMLFVSSCTNDFEEINSNPNGPEDVKAQFLLANVISILADRSTYDQAYFISDFIVQYAASVEFERVDRYEMGSNSDYWDLLYGLLSDIESMKNAEGSNEAFEAVGEIMSCVIFTKLTDMWGDVPYSEAIGGREGVFTPAYDTQEFIYTDPESGILARLRNAVQVLENTNSSIEGDLMYDNDLEKWIKFANSLRVRYTLRISKRLTDFTELQELADNGLLMESNDDNAVVPYLSSAPNRFPLFIASQGTYNERRMTVTIDSILTLYDDPRIEVLYKPTEKSVQEGNPQYKGLLNGQNRETISEKGIELNDISLFGSIFRDVPDGVNGQFMQYAELQFALAEAVERGYITGDLQTYYRNGVKAAMNYYNVEVPADYFDREPITLGEDNLTKILTQKWLCLHTNDHEAWFNIRRTGIPHMEPGPDNLNNDRFPVRYLYPQDEQATNSANYNKASSRIGGDNINSKGWWEKE